MEGPKYQIFFTLKKSNSSNVICNKLATPKMNSFQEISF